MAGIYIHIPFCKEACSYCDFHFSTKLTNKKSVVSAIEKELELRSNYIGKELVDTIYIGGGTPSLLNEVELQSIFHAVLHNYNVSENAEITLEGNPDDLTKKKLKELKQTPINRLSIGVQSFFEEDLRFMNRAHNATEAIESIQNAKEVGFDSISIDLIFGSQTTTNEMWQKNLETFFELGINHLSAYSLTIEEKTALAHNIAKGKVENVDDEKNYTQYLMLQNAIQLQGFEQYELSNYCKNESYSKHNTSYWQSKNYLGIGPSAHSFDGTSRQWNVRNNSLYLKAIDNKTSYFEKEGLTEIDRYHEFLITSLRTKWGINVAELKVLFSPFIVDHFNRKILSINKSTIDLSNKCLVVKSAYLFQSDDVVRELMIDFNA
ncbi:radical SAM family heme chaperone HemW [Vicingaceae bacterium]|nr:radical SAM family heme chaperone HemW [Vicingaceae bacterium]